MSLTQPLWIVYLNSKVEGVIIKSTLHGILVISYYPANIWKAPNSMQRRTDTRPILKPKKTEIESFRYLGISYFTPNILTLWHHHIHQSFHAVWCNIHYCCYMSFEIWIDLDWWSILPFYRRNSIANKRNMSISQVPRARRIPRKTFEAVRQ